MVLTQLKMPLVRNMLGAVFLNILFFYWNLFYSPIFMMFFTFWTCMLIAVSLSPKMKLDSGSSIMAHGNLFGKDKWYPPPIINCVINFKNGAPSVEVLKRKCKRMLQFQRLRSVLVDHELSYFRELDDRQDIEVDDMLYLHELEKDKQHDLLESLVNRQLDYNKPLWELHYVHDEKFEEGKIIIRVNHGLGDGIRLSTVFFPIFFDDEKGSPVRLPKFGKKNKGDKKSRKGFDPLGSVNWLLNGLKIVDKATKEVDTDTAFGNPKQMLGTESYKCSANAQILQLEMVKEIKNKLGCTVNDVLMCALTLSLRKYLVKRGQKFDDKFLFRCWCALGIPTYDDTKLKNHFGLLPANIPVQLEKRDEILKEIQKSMEKIKTTGGLMITLVVQSIISYLGIDRFAEGMLIDSFLNTSLVYSNVPSIQAPLFVEGKEVDSLGCFFPNVMPQIILVSYNNQIRMSLCTDGKMVENPEEVTNVFVEEVKIWHTELFGAATTQS